MEVKEFRFLNIDDDCNLKYDNWSRIYEYPYVLNTLKKLGANAESRIHNTAWGSTGCHVMFKDDLDNQYPHCVHSDTNPPTVPNTMYYDVTEQIEDDFKSLFDFVLSVCTINELNFSPIRVIKNLMEHVKVGGYLIATFDVADDGHLENVYNSKPAYHQLESYFKKQMDEGVVEKQLRGGNSKLPILRWDYLRSGVLVIQKTA